MDKINITPIVAINKNGSVLNFLSSHLPKKEPIITGAAIQTDNRENISTLFCHQTLFFSSVIQK